MPFLLNELGRNMEQSYRMELWCPWTTDLSPLSLKSDPPRVYVCVCICWSVLGKGCLQLDAYWAPGCWRVGGLLEVWWGGGGTRVKLFVFSVSNGKGSAWAGDAEATWQKTWGCLVASVSFYFVTVCVAVAGGGGVFRLASLTDDF